MSVPLVIGKIIDFIYTNAESHHSMLVSLRLACYALCGVFVAGAAANFGRLYLMQTAGIYSMVAIILLLCVQCDNDGFII